MRLTSYLSELSLTIPLKVLPRIHATEPRLNGLTLFARIGVQTVSRQGHRYSGFAVYISKQQTRCVAAFELVPAWMIA